MWYNTLIYNSIFGTIASSLASSFAILAVAILYPPIDIIINPNMIIVIAKNIVTDMLGLQSVTYQWNTEEVQTAYPEEGNSQKIEINTDIPTGLNTIKIRAVNKL
mgnify:CR=1 FL=1